jgi:thiol-disulfide isomerase/thioredoxin
MKRILSLLVLMFCLFCLSSEAETREMQDFTVQTLDGSFHLSEVLQEKKMVLINFFASWCGPCKKEFPYMEEAYKQYADSVAVLALSVEPNDTTDVLRSYAEENGLSFSVGSDAGAGISAQFDTSAIPVTVVVDRFGQIVLEEAGARSSADDFIHLFDYMTSDYYTKSVPLNGFPSGRADAESETPEKLAEALGFESRPDEYGDETYVRTIDGWWQV